MIEPLRATDAAVPLRTDWGGVPRTDVFGVRCFRGTLEEATTLVVQNALGGVGGYGCLCNVHVLETARRDPQVSAALDRAQIVFPDGAPIAWTQRLIEPGPAERIGGPDLLENVVRVGSAFGLRHAFYGSTPTVLERLRESLSRRYPAVDIVASIAPPFAPRLDQELEADLAQLRDVRPHIVWVSLGAPRQELWAARHAAALAPALVLGVGAALDFLSGAKPRAPRWMQGAGLEWLHRLSTEPRRLGMRYLTTNSRFITRASVLALRAAPRRSRLWS